MKISTITTIVVSLGITIAVTAGVVYIKKQFLDDGSFLTTDTIKADKVTRVSAAGGDLRMYEITPTTAPHMLCVTIAGDSTSSTDCFRKDK